MTNLVRGILVSLLLLASVNAQQSPAPQQTKRPAPQQRTSQRRTPQRQAQRSPVTPQKNASPNVRIGSATNGETARMQAPQVPVGFPLKANEQARVNDVLAFWEQNTTAIKTFSCNFTKWDYDGVFGIKQGNKLLPKSESDGILKYSKPDKGLYQVKEVRDLVPPKAGEKPRFKKRDGSLAERWVCDGSTVYEFDFQRKQLVETVLPPDMRGQAITNGPLPFMFGARANEIKQRYWIRELTPPKTVRNQYWLEAYPKRREDAANFRRVVIFLDQKEFLPIAMRVYERNGKSYSAYAFKNRKKNDFVANVQGVFRKYIPKQLPVGWQRVKRNYGETLAKTPKQRAARGPAAGAKSVPSTAGRIVPRKQAQRK